MAIQPSGFQSNQMFEWVEDMPRPRINKSMRKEQIQELYHAAGALLYRGEWNADTQQFVIKDPRFIGATYAEVAVMLDWDEAVKSDGGKSRERVMDRTLGKPKQALESTSMHVSYSEYLDQLAKEEEAAKQQIVDVFYTTAEEYNGEDIDLDGI